MTSVVLIGDGAFSQCMLLESIVIPNSVTVIGTNCFSDCYSLTSVTLPDSINAINSGTFQGTLAPPPFANNDVAKVYILPFAKPSRCSSVRAVHATKVCDAVALSH
jgi:hypothetical protein